MENERFDWIICLCEKNEFLRKANNTQDGIYSSIYSEYKCINLPIENYKIPKSFKHLLIVLEEIDRLLLEGNKCVIHCSAGVGRTGLLIACYLIYRGRSVEEAIQITKSNITPALKSRTIRLFTYFSKKVFKKLNNKFVFICILYFVLYNTYFKFQNSKFKMKLLILPHQLFPIEYIKKGLKEKNR